MHAMRITRCAPLPSQLLPPCCAVKHSMVRAAWSGCWFLPCSAPLAHLLRALLLLLLLAMAVAVAVAVAAVGVVGVERLLPWLPA